MMKFKLTFLFCLFFIQWAITQSTDKKIHFGFSLTPQIGMAQFKSELVAENQSGISYILGGDLLIDLSPKTQFITGLMLHHVKLKYRDYSPLFPDDVDEFGNALIYKSYWDFNYGDLFIGIPVNLKIKLNSSEKANHFFLNGGCKVQHLLLNSGYVILNESGHLQEKRDPDQYYFGFQKTWLLPNVGFGYEFTLGKGKFSIQPDYEFSLSKIFRKKYSIDANGYVRFLGLRLAYY
ncbi:MAG TPA: hypothetical protein VFG10_15690 [Saprospiraceae bacterium]|nr:hypothetical protein [Saprospiraceae bacterium]